MVVLLLFVGMLKPFSGLISVGCYLGLLYLFGYVSISNLVNQSGWILYVGIPLYIASGVLWGVIKWFLFVKREATRYKEKRQKFLQLMGCLDADINTLVPQNMKRDWGRVGHHIKSNSKDHKWRIITWMAYWPMSMLWSIIDEPWRYLYEYLSSLFHKIFWTSVQRSWIWLRYNRVINPTTGTLSVL